MKLLFEDWHERHPVASQGYNDESLGDFFEAATALARIDQSQDREARLLHSVINSETVRPRLPTAGSGEFNAVRDAIEHLLEVFTRPPLYFSEGAYGPSGAWSKKLADYMHLTKGWCEIVEFRQRVALHFFLKRYLGRIRELSSLFFGTACLSNMR